MNSPPPVGTPPLTESTQTEPSNSGNPLIDAILQQKELEAKKLRWAQWVDTEYTKCKNSRAVFERQWFLNLAFYLGKHYLSPIEVSGQGFRLTTPKAPPWRVRIVVNLIRTAVTRECAKLTSSKPIPTVVPSSNESDDFTAAGVGEQLIKTRYATGEFSEQYHDWVWWGSICGVAFMKQWWDPNSLDYESMAVPEPLQMPEAAGGGPVPDELLEMIPGAKEYMETPTPAKGKICSERVNPFHVFVPDLLTRRLEGQPYVMQVMTKSPEWVKKTYGLEDVSCDSRASSTIMDAATLITRGSEEHLDAVLVKECWIKPGSHPDFPEGGVITVVNQKCVAVSEKWPLPFPEYPFYKFEGLPTGGFYSDSSIVDLIGLNKEYNRSRSQMVEIKNTMGKPKIVYQQGSLNPRQISSEPGQSIPYKVGYNPPTPIAGSEVPATFYQELQVLRGDFDDISGQHEISRGQTPTDVTSGTAIAFLQEQDDSLLNTKISSIELACEYMGKHYLSLVSKYWDDQRVVKVTGKNQEFEAITWKKNMLRGNIDVRVQTGSALPVSKAAKMAMITEWMQNGFMDPVTGMEIMEMGDLNKVANEILVDKRQAQRENLKLAQAPEKILTMLMNPAPGPNGEQPQQMQDGTVLNGDGSPFQPQPPIPVNAWDNNEEHIKWHNHFRKTQEFELLPEANKQAFQMHVQMHEMALMATMVNPEGQVIQQGEQPPEEEPPADNGEQGQPPPEPPQQ